MAKNKITEYSTTATSNSDVGNIQIEGSDNVANFDNALRELMKHIADLNTGASFIHDTYKIADSDDETKLAKFNAGSITAGQTRTFTFPDKDGTFAVADDVLALSGGTLTGFVTLHAGPTADLHAATKKYVDDNAATTDSPIFTGDAEFENISDGTTGVDAGYLVNGSAKAHMSFTGTGTVAIKNSLNVSSLTDAGTGTYAMNFTAAMDDNDFIYSVSGGNGPGGGNNTFQGGNTSTSGTSTTGAFKFQTHVQSGSVADPSEASIIIMGDLN